MATRKKLKVKNDLTVKVRDVYGLVRQAVEVGVGYGLRRSVKYTETSTVDLDDPTEFERVRDAVVEGVMGDLCELLEFPDPYA
jgi:hypothetical protein